MRSQNDLSVRRNDAKTLDECSTNLVIKMNNVKLAIPDLLETVEREVDALQLVVGQIELIELWKSAKHVLVINAPRVFALQPSNILKYKEI